MATKQVFLQCVKGAKEMGVRPILSCKTLRFLFGVVELISESELVKRSEVEQNRHLFQDRVLRALYIKDDPEFRGPFKRNTDIKHEIDTD